jgi:hypothetical protein
LAVSNQAFAYAYGSPLNESKKGGSNNRRRPDGRQRAEGRRMKVKPPYFFRHSAFCLHTSAFIPHPTDA